MAIGGVLPLGAHLPRPFGPPGIGGDHEPRFPARGECWVGFSRWSVPERSGERSFAAPFAGDAPFAVDAECEGSAGSSCSS